VLPLPDCDQLPERCREPMPRRSALLRPWVRFHERPATQRAEATHTPPATVGTLQRRCAPPGMLGLVPDAVEVVPSGARPRVSDAVMQALQRLQGLDDGFPSRERARIISDTLADRLGDHTVTRLWPQRPGTSPPQLPLRDSHRYPARAHARFAVIQLSVQGGSTTSLSRFLPVSRPPINAGMDRCERDPFARLEDQSAAPTTPAGKAWLPVLREMDHGPKRPPEAGGFRMGSLRGHTDRSVRPVARIMAVNRQVDDALPHVGRKRTKTAPQRQPFKASGAQASWCMDGRMMAFACDGVQGGSLIGLDGSARPRLAGAVAPPEASWGALTVLSSACRR